MDEDQLRLFNFLKHYNLDKYLEPFQKLGVVKISHLKDVDEQDLTNMGMTRPEMHRLKKKVEENFSKVGKLVKKIAGKDHQFDTLDGSTLQQQQQSVTVETASAAAAATDTAASVAKSPIIISADNIKLGEKLGEGAHGAVHEATLVNEQGQRRVAVKTVYTQDKGPSVEAMFIKEAQSMVKLNHQHIIKLFGIVLGSPLMLVEEIAPFGNLLSFLKTKTVPISLMHTYALQIADAMRYLENMNIIHRDLAARNILLLRRDHVLLSDFGLARTSSVYTQTNFDIPLPTYWLALEAFSEGKFTSASDVWSYGVLLWEITSMGQRPWEGYKPKEVYHKLTFGERLPCPKYCYQKLYAIMKSCWMEKPDDRPKFTELYDTLLKTAPPTVHVTERHSSGYDNAILKEGEELYVLNRQEGERLWWIGMTMKGHVISFNEEKVKFHPSQKPSLPVTTLNRDQSPLPWEQKYEMIKAHVPIDHPEEANAGTDQDLTDSFGPYLTMKSPLATPVADPTDDSPLRQRSTSSLLDESLTLNDYLPCPLQPDSPVNTLKEEGDKPSTSVAAMFDPLHTSKVPTKPTNSSAHVSPSRLPVSPVSSTSRPFITPRSTKPAVSSAISSSPATQTSSSSTKATLTTSTSVPIIAQYSYLESPSNDTTSDHWDYRQIWTVERRETTASPRPAVPTQSSAIGQDSSTIEPTNRPNLWTVGHKDTSASSGHSGHIPSVSSSSAVSPVRSNSPVASNNRAVFTSSPRQASDRQLPPVPPRKPTKTFDTGAYNKPRPLEKPTIPSRSDELMRRLKAEFPDVTDRTLEKAAAKSGGDLERGRQEVKVQQLLAFGLQYIDEEDCRRALTHCQGKLDRAGSWLLEQNETITSRKKINS